MKEMHAYRNDDGTYQLEVIAEFYEGNELKEAHIVYPSVDIVSDNLHIVTHGELFRVEINE